MPLRSCVANPARRRAAGHARRLRRRDGGDHSRRGAALGLLNAFIPALFFGGILLAVAAARMPDGRAAAARPALLALSVAAAPGGLVWAADRVWPRAGFALPVGYDPRALVPTAADRVPATRSSRA